MPLNGENLIIIYAAQSRFTDTPREFVRQVYGALVKKDQQ